MNSAEMEELLFALMDAIEKSGVYVHNGTSWRITPAVAAQTAMRVLHERSIIH